MPILPRTLGKPRACFRVRGMLTILLHLGNFQLAELGNFQLARIGEFSTGADTWRACGCRGEATGRGCLARLRLPG